MIDKTGVSPDESKIAAVKDYPIPVNVKTLRAFLGLSGYYRRFIRNYAEIAIPLYALTKKVQLSSGMQNVHLHFNG